MLVPPHVHLNLARLERHIEPFDLIRQHRNVVLLRALQLLRDLETTELRLQPRDLRSLVLNHQMHLINLSRGFVVTRLHRSQLEISTFDLILKLILPSSSIKQLILQVLDLGCLSSEGLLLFLL
jgi:hypothetical protein